MLLNTNSVSERNVLLMVFINAFATPLMLSATNVALPYIAKDLDMTAIALSWVPMIFLMASAMFVLSFGRIADMYGRKRIFIFGSSCLILSSIGAALSTTVYVLLTFRFLQGLSAAMLYATQIAIISSVFMPPKRGKMIGLTISMIYFGLTIGPLFGGYLIENFGWQSVFIFHIPLAAIALFFALFIVKEEWLSEAELKFDYIGSLLYAVAIVTLCVAVTFLPDIKAYGLIIFSLCCFSAFYINQKDKTSPLLNVKLLTSHRLFSMSCMASLLIYTATFSNVVLISLYLQYVRNISAFDAGLIMMLQPLAMALAAPFSGKYMEKMEPRYLATLGLVILSIGLFMLSVLNSESEIAYIILALVLTGTGFGLFSSPNVSVIMGSIDKRYLGSANAVVATMRVLGQLTSMILVTSCMTYIIGQQTIETNLSGLLEATRLCFLIALCFSLTAAIASFSRGKQRVLS